MPGGREGGYCCPPPQRSRQSTRVLYLYIFLDAHQFGVETVSEAGRRLAKEVLLEQIEVIWDQLGGGLRASETGKRVNA